jgi:hypothetical protein
MCPETCMRPVFVRIHVYVSAYVYMCRLKRVCVLVPLHLGISLQEVPGKGLIPPRILVYMCPHTCTYLSSYLDRSVFILACVLILLYQDIHACSKHEDKSRETVFSYAIYEDTYTHVWYADTYTYAARVIRLYSVRDAVRFMRTHIHICVVCGHTHVCGHIHVCGQSHKTVFIARCCAIL